MDSLNVALSEGVSAESNRQSPSDETTATVDALFEPFTFANVTIRNRFVMAPMSRQRSPNGAPVEESAEYYRLRAAGGVGLIITEPAYIPGPAVGPNTDVPRMYGSVRADGWRRIADAIHSEGATVFAQLWHVGAQRGVNPEFEPHLESVSPSGIGTDGEPVGAELDQRGLQLIVRGFAHAALRAREWGFDGVELNAAHGFLLDQFHWSRTNRRSDQYGGGPAERAAFPCAVVRAIKAAAGPDFPVSYRFSQWKIGDYGASIASDVHELREILLPLTKAGVDVFHSSTRRHWDGAFEPDGPTSLAALTKSITGLPTITVGSVGVGESGGLSDAPTGASLLEQFVRGDFDMVAVGRALLADPDWVAKLRRLGSQ